MSRFTSGRFRILCICVAGVFAALLAGLVAYRARPESLPSYRQVRDGYAGSETVLLDRHGEIIHELRADRRARRLEWVALKDISPALQAAVIYAEDRRVYHHDGVSWPSLGGVAVGMLGGSGLRGASTITMQLAAQLDENLRPRSARRTLVQKLRQITEARALEKKWSKAEILEAYLNLVTWRGELT